MAAPAEVGRSCEGLGAVCGVALLGAPCAQGRAVCLWRDRVGDDDPGMCRGCNSVCRFFSLGSRLRENIYRCVSTVLGVVRL